MTGLFWSCAADHGAAGSSCWSRLWRRAEGHAAAQVAAEDGRQGRQLHAIRCECGNDARGATGCEESGEGGKIFPLVCDLATADDLFQSSPRTALRTTRLITFFGMIPNFEPQDILLKLARLVRRRDVAVQREPRSRPDYAAGVAKIPAV